MKKLLMIFISIVLILSIAGCASKENEIETSSATETVPSESQSAVTDNWDFYNERAEVFVTAMASSDFDAAVDMLDTTMKQALPAPTLEDNVWKVIIEQVGAFIGVYDIENSVIGGYYVCFVTSQHESRGVTLRVIFSEDGLVAGLFIDGYPVIAGEVAEHEGFTDSAVVIGEGTNYPLNGVLSIPDNIVGKMPAVVLVHGSGPQDKDETINSNKPFRDISEYLAANGIAVIRYDKRTFTYGAEMVEELGSSLTVKEETIEDAILASKILKSDPRIDEDKVYILGHSLGGMLAPRIHASGGDFAGIISLAGSPRSLLDIIYDQQMASIDVLPKGDEKTAALSQVETYVEQVETLKSLSDDEAKNTLILNGLCAYYFKEMEDHPVSEYIDGMTVPFLVLQGDKDFQVYPDKDFVMWQELLKGRENVTFKLYEGLNHLFMPSSGKNITEYQEEYRVESQMDSQVLLDIMEWIKAN